MDISFDALPTLVGLAILLFILYMVMYYKFIYSVVDPLFIFVFTTSFASVLAVLVIPDVIDIFHFFGCQIALWAGFVIAYCGKLQYSNENIDQSEKKYHLYDQYILRWVTYLLFIIYFVSNMIIGYSKGFALLSDNPSTSKFANFQEGFGLLRRVSWSTGTFASTSLIFMYLFYQKKADFLMLIIIVFFSSLEGSKGALLQIAISAGILLYHPVFADKKSLIKKFQRYFPLMFVAIMGVFFTVLLKENDGLEEAFLGFIKRLLYGADSVLYFYTPINIDYFASYSYGEYVSRLFNPILGFFRILPYKEAIGNVLYDNLRPPDSVATTITVGPNIPFYMEGRIFFYFWPAFPYCVFIGYLYAIIRIHYFSLIKTSAFYFVFIASFFHFAYAIIVDTTLAVTQLFDLVFFVFPPYVMVRILINRKISFQLNLKLIKFLINR